MNDDSRFDRVDLQQSTSRRGAIGRIGKMGLAAAAMPVAFGTLAREAKAQELPQEVIDILNFALTLEYLEAEFYDRAVNTEGLIPSDVQGVFEEIGNHENAHVVVLEGALGDQAIERPTFDFTVGGQFQPFENYETFLLLSQGFEDLGVRAYKGQAPNLMENDEILTTALRIHSVEARHAGEVRRIRGLSAWIPGAGENISADSPIKPVYEGEDQTTQAGVSLTDEVSGDQLVGENPDEQITESFDEPLSMEDVLNIAQQFIEEQ